MMILAVHGHRIIAYDILAKGETVDGQRFKRFLIERLRPKLIQLRIRDPIILMDNARPHFSRLYGEIGNFWITLLIAQI
jgi:hypothetical protein